MARAGMRWARSRGSLPRVRAGEIVADINMTIVENGCGPDEKGGAALMVAGRFFDRINKIIQDLQDGDGGGEWTGW